MRQQLIECGSGNWKPSSNPESDVEASLCPSPCHWLSLFLPRKLPCLICLLFTRPLASSDRFQPAVFEERGAVNHSEVGFINGRHVITARPSNLKSLWPKCLVSFIKTKWALGMDAITL